MKLHNSSKVKYISQFKTPETIFSELWFLLLSCAMYLLFPLKL